MDKYAIRKQNTREGITTRLKLMRENCILIVSTTKTNNNLIVIIFSKFSFK